MQLHVKKLSTDPLLLDKRPYFTDPVVYNVQVNNPLNVDAPTFILHVTGVFDANYAYVPEWGKYYFLGEPTYLDGNRMAVTGQCDVLTTNADEIKLLSINVSRAGSNTNALLADRLRPSQANRQSEIITLKNSFSPAAVGDIRYILTVQGGAHL